MKIYSQNKQTLNSLIDLGTQYGNVYGKPIVNHVEISGLNGVEITDTEGLILFMLDRITCLDGLLSRTPQP